MRRSLAALLVLAFAAPAAACLWDYDTLQMERQRFPGALELIVGKFLRHSDTFYDWRVKDRRAKITAHESGEKKLSYEQLAAAYDDLAVALDKLGKHDEAIAAIREKAGHLPKTGAYETHANLGTFLVHSGRLEEGVAELRKAIEINPDAHFGREKYQVLVAEYVAEKSGSDGKTKLPLDNSYRHGEGLAPFTHWLLAKEGLVNSSWEIPDRSAAEEEIERAVKGVLGMMRFGDYRSPVLLEVLGDLLLTGSNIRHKNLGERLAARAYLRAAEGARSDEEREAYRELAKWPLTSQSPDVASGEREATREEEGYGLSFRQLEDQLHREVLEANDWFKGVAYDEELWVAKSADPDAKFWGKYGGQEVRVGRDRLPPGKFATKGLPLPAVLGLAFGALAMAGVIVGAIAWRRRRPTGYGAPGIHEVEPSGADRQG